MKQAAAASSDKRRILRAIWRDKMHVDKEALDLSSAAVRQAYEHIWAPADQLMAQLCYLPAGLLSLWQASARGHLVFSHRPSSYLPGPQPWRDRSLDGICTLCLAELVRDEPTPWWALYRLFDHLMGSDGDDGGLWLSDGAGITPELAAVGQRFQRIQQLGYGHEELDVSSTHGYFARTLHLYRREPRRLNVLDPQVERLYRSTLMQEKWWATL